MFDFESLCESRININRINKDKNVVVWGCSDGGSYVKSVLDRQGISIDRFVDNSYDLSLTFLGCKVDRPNTLNPETD
ncbi:MAG: hypothetical protein IJS24_08300, partial [Eubacterium sp.]|nr:hypothetical protein [Eubacterium sp.]